MNKDVIAVDCDDVLVATAPEILRYYNRTYGTNIQLKDFYSNDNTNVWQTPDDDTAIKRVNAFLETDEYFSLPPTQDAISVIRRLKQQYELHIVTGRPDFTEAATLKWLKHNFPDIFSTVVFTNYFSLSDSSSVPRSKADVCKELGAKFLIDDHINHALRVADVGIDVMLFGDYPWNQTTKALPQNIRRVAGWKEVEKLLLDGAD
jgi:5'(3')-deoxyribonucleotidase